MPKHVVVVTDSASVDGGSARVALSSARALAEGGTSVTLFVAGGVPSAELATCPNLRIVSTEQGDVLASGNRIGGAVRGLWNVRAFTMMRALLATLDRRDTVVHVHGWTKALSSSVLAAVKWSRFPLVVTLHEYFTVCPTGCLYLHRDRRVCNLRPMSLACIVKDCDSRSYSYKMYRVIRQLVQAYIARVPAAVVNFITVSPFSRAVLESSLPKRSRFFEVMNPVDVERTARVHAEDNVGVVFVGRLSAEKGGILLGEAASSANIRVTFVGEGAEHAAVMQRNPQARVTGWLDHRAVVAALRSARAVVIPSLWYETFGLVVMEAAALGIPAIVPRHTAPGDLVEPGKTGLVFERGDLEDLTSKLRMLADDDRVAAMSLAAYDAYWKHPPTMQSHITKLTTTYETVLDDAGFSPPAVVA
jgi:glycosyltransferase involved in cell wall biosynthesis